MPLSTTVLVENHSADPRLAKARGLSLFLDDGQQRILFDTGPDARLITHAAALGIDLASVSHIVLSHGHIDHSGGLEALAQWFGARHLRPTLIAHPDVFNPRCVRLGWGRFGITLRQMGMSISQTLASQAFDLLLTRLPLSIDGGRFTFLGEIPRVLDFERVATLGWIPQRSGFRADPILDDSGLSWAGQDGQVVFSGCAHSGICNLVGHARTLGDDARINAVLGGFHLRSAGPLHLARVRQYFTRLGVSHLSACHCSGWGRWWLAQQHNSGSGSHFTFR
jgi:7,8-dihydropterin-6-yl-methyl-4-(beta-D-ribofuranosyl)aminobenzene 5'-phosphate synthase